MPYVITARTLRDHFGSNLESYDTARRAVAALEEADPYLRGLFEALIPWPSDPQTSRSAASWLATLQATGDGFTLPDGTVIAVEQVSWDEMATLAPTGGAQGTADLLAAYNAQHAPALNH